MSNAVGAVKFADNTIWYFEYSGSSDHPCSRLYQDRYKVNQKWRQGSSGICICGSHEKLIAYTAYGGTGFYFNAKACKKCHSVEVNDNGYSFIIDPEDTEDWAMEVPYFKKDREENM